jgi:hypothetical protein
MFFNKYPGEKDSLVWYFLPDGDPLTVRDRDTAYVRFYTKGLKDVAMVIYHDGRSDSIYRAKNIEVDTTMHVSISKNFLEFYWKGNDLVLEGYGADDYTWLELPDKDTLFGAVLTARPDTTVTYRLCASEGECRDTTEITVEVWPNDQVRYATELTYGENGPFINMEATTEEGEPYPPAGDCNTDSTWCDEFETGTGYLAHSVWFRFVASETGVVSIDTKGFDNQIALYDAASPDSLLAGHYTLLAANDDYHNSDDKYAAAIEEVSGLTPGKTYWLQVDGSGGNQTNYFTVFLYNSPLAAPSLQAKNRESRLFTLYPNPNDGSFVLMLNQPLPAGGQMRIYAGDGKLVYQQALSPAAAGQQITPSVRIAEKGLYILMIRTSRKVYTSRMIVR